MMRRENRVGGTRTIFPSAREVLCRGFIAALVLFAVVSVGQGFLNAVRNSQDLQWSPVSLLAAGINPYTVALEGNPNGALILYQVPPYLHILYLVTLPLALLTLKSAATDWAVLGIGVSVFTIFNIGKRSGLNLLQSTILFLVFLCGTPFRNALGNGQTSLVLFFFLAMSWHRRAEAWSGGALAIASAKYSLSPPVWLWLAAERNVVSLLVSVASLVFGWLAFSALAHSPPMETIVQPFAVAKKYSLDGGVGDIMTATRLLGLDFPVLGSVGTSYVAAVLASVMAFFIVWRRRPHLDENTVFAALCIVSLLAFRHLGYDYVLLAPAMAISLSVKGTVRWVLLGCVVYFWFGLKAFDVIGMDTSGLTMVLCSLAVNLILLSAILWPKPAHGPSPIGQ
jgi:hypothetical protein